MAIVITPDTVQRAIDSLLKWRTSQSQTQKPKLFDQDDEFIYLILTLKKVPPKGRVNPHKVPLPHSLTSEFSERCLIIDDRPKSNLTKADSQKKIKSDDIPISKVLKLSKLASDYRAFEAKRKLCDSYDMFFADKRIVPLLPRLLGKQFFKKKKVPVPLDLKKKNWKEQVEKACSSGLLTLRTGTCSVVRVAKVSMERDEIVENVVAAIGGVVEIIPKKWGNVRSFHVKLLESLALPVYQAVPDIKLRIEGSKAEVEEAEMKKKEESEKEEESEGGEVRDRKAGKKKKGRIHQVRYMDDDKVGEDVVEDKSGSEDDGKNAGDSDNDEKGSVELVNKKRKKGVKVENGAVSELSSIQKKLKKSAKESSKEKKKDGKEKLIEQSKSEDEKSDKKKGNLTKQSKSEDEESGRKTKKKGNLIKQSKSEDEESGKKKKKKGNLIKQSKSEDEESGKMKNKAVDVKAKAKKSKKSA